MHNTPIVYSYIRDGSLLKLYVVLELNRASYTYRNIQVTKRKRKYTLRDNILYGI